MSFSKNKPTVARNLSIIAGILILPIVFSETLDVVNKTHSLDGIMNIYKLKVQQPTEFTVPKDTLDSLPYKISLPVNQYKQFIKD